ncbi:hypothetical protein D3C84_789850 [compost metagenome]
MLGKGNSIIVGLDQCTPSLDVARFSNGFVDRLVLNVTEKIVLVAARPRGVVQALIIATRNHQGVHVLSALVISQVIGQPLERIEVPVGHGGTGRYPVEIGWIKAVIANGAGKEAGRE